MEKVIMPKALTAENGAKGAMSGEFFIKQAFPCGVCDGHFGACDMCDDNGEIVMDISVDWTTIKAIYAMAEDLFSQPLQDKD